MTTVKDLFEILEELGADPDLIKPDSSQISLCDFSRIANWISLQLQFFDKTDSVVQIIKDDTDLVSLQIELNSLLHEIDSIYCDSCSCINENATDRANILHSLCGDLLSARLRYVKQDDSIEDDTGGDDDRLNPRRDLLTINACFAIADDLTDLRSYFAKICAKIDCTQTLDSEDSLLLPDARTLSGAQWRELRRLNETLRGEYSIRREMLLRRADTTVASFGWKEDASGAMDDAALKTLIGRQRAAMSLAPSVTLASALAARTSECDSLINDMISTKHANCVIDTPAITGLANRGTQQRLQLHRYLIGAVPDRGGRPHEQAAPPRETFASQSQRPQRDNHRRGGGGGGGRGRREDTNYRTNHQNRGNDNYNNANNYGSRRHVPANQSSNRRIQGAGWQQNPYDGAGVQYNSQANNNNYHRGGGSYQQQQQSQSQNYEQYQSGHQRFAGYQSGQNEAYYQDEHKYAGYHQQQQGYQGPSEYQTRGKGRGRGGGGGFYRNSNY